MSTSAAEVMVRCMDNNIVNHCRRKVLVDTKQNYWAGGVFTSGKGVVRKWWPATFRRGASSATKQIEVQVCCWQQKALLLSHYSAA